MISSRKNWFWIMWALSLLALFSLFASSALAANCCCDEMGETGHTYHQEFETKASAFVSRNAAHNAQIPTIEVCKHQQCEAASFVVNREKIQAFFLMPFLIAPVRAFELPFFAAPTAATSVYHVARPRVPDRLLSSGLSPPALLRS